MYPAEYVKCPIRIAPSSFADEVVMNESVHIVYITKHGERSVGVQEFWVMDIPAYVDFLSTTETSRKLNRDQADQTVSVLTFEFVFQRFNRITGVQLRVSLITITLLIGSCGYLLPGMELFVLIGSFANQFVNFMTMESYLPADFDSTPPIVTIAGCLALETVFFIIWRFFSWQVRAKYDFPINTPSKYYLHESYPVLLMIVLAIDKIRPALYFFLCIVNLYNVVIYS
ncbi:hypothetical protein CRE_16742 [Caenorhabditis remanei]|uniref:Uncharacterized protein n=1 Tax=Caenorhabditis remanei TaxID=31234 RepID=E3MAR7_CAERE|nr:hypothetical protein CRE_16742 [Caenorhabditis remanei]